MLKFSLDIRRLRVYASKSLGEAVTQIRLAELTGLSLATIQRLEGEGPRRVSVKTEAALTAFAERVGYPTRTKNTEQE